MPTLIVIWVPRSLGDRKPQGVSPANASHSELPVVTHAMSMFDDRCDITCQCVVEFASYRRWQWHTRSLS